MGRKQFHDLIKDWTPARKARVQAEADVMLADLHLAEVRRARQLTQTALAQTLGTSQGEISRMEHRADVYISTLRSYIEAMGGELELFARFKGQILRISQFQDLGGRLDANDAAPKPSRPKVTTARR